MYVPEFLVVFDFFVEIAKEYGLRLVEKKNFHEIYDYEMNSKYDYNRKLFERMVNNKDNQS